MKPPEQLRTSEWKQHSQDPVPNIFGDETKKEPLNNGFYKQAGSVPSNASWESVAHYTFLAYNNIKIGKASFPYSISPSGRFVIIPEVYYHNAPQYKLKIYDKKLNQFLLRNVKPKAISNYIWSNKERTIKVFFANAEKPTILSIPEPN